MTETTCGTCGKKIHFAKTPTGSMIPLDLIAPVYELHADGTCTRAPEHHVTHFATCPQASQHSKRKEAKP